MEKLEAMLWETPAIADERNSSTRPIIHGNKKSNMEETNGLIFVNIGKASFRC